MFWSPFHLRHLQHCSLIFAILPKLNPRCLRLEYKWAAPCTLVYCRMNIVGPSNWVLSREFYNTRGLLFECRREKAGQKEIDSFSFNGWTSNLHLVLGLRISGAILLFPLYAFMAWTWRSFNLALYLDHVSLRIYWSKFSQWRSRQEMVHTLANGGKNCCIYVGLCALSQGVSSNILYSLIVTLFILRITLVRNEESVALKILREECIIKALLVWFY
jgi:hypothetical protein